MPLDESLLQRFGGLQLPAEANETDSTLTSLDPARDTLLALFAAAINSELGAAWTAVVRDLPVDHRLSGTSPVQSTLPFIPTEQHLLQVKKGFPILCLAREGRGEFADHGLELDKLTQPWKLHWIIGPLDVIDQRKILDIGQAIAKVLRLVIRKRGHKAYQSGALQFFDDTTPLSSVELTGFVGPAHAGYAGDASTVIFWAVEADLVTTEISADLEDSGGCDIDALDLMLGVGDETEIVPAMVIAQSDAEPEGSGSGISISDPEIALWYVDNRSLSVGGDGGFSVVGYTEQQIASSYSGDPAVKLDLADITNVGVGHGLCVFTDGTLVVAASESTGQPQTEESWVVIPANLTWRSRTFTTGDLRRITCGDFDGTRGDTGARLAVQVPDGNVVLGRDYYVYLTQAQLRGDSVVGAPISEPASAGQVLGWGIHSDATGVWQSGGNTIWHETHADIRAGGTLTIDKIAKGSNLTAGSLGDLAFDLSGGCWVVDDSANALRYFDAATIGALTGSQSNPAATRSLTCSSFGDAFGITIDTSGGMWVSDYVLAGKLHYFTAAQLLAGGAQTPTRTITTATSHPLFPRLTRRYAQILR